MNTGMTCLFCGNEIKVFKKNKKNCFICNKTELTTEACIEGHFICSDCTSSEAFDLIENYCLNTNETEPVKIAQTIFKFPNVKIHGQEHHYIVPAVLIAAYFNIFPDEVRKTEYLKAAKARSSRIPAGMCGFMGVCGAAIGAGTFMSLITNSFPTSGLEWQLSNMLTADTLKRIALVGGPRCCKRDTLIAIDESIRFLKQKFNKVLDHKSDYTCEFSYSNKECIADGCSFNKINENI